MATPSSKAGFAQEEDVIYADLNDFDEAKKAFLRDQEEEEEVVVPNGRERAYTWQDNGYYPTQNHTGHNASFSAVRQQAQLEGLIPHVLYEPSSEQSNNTQIKRPVVRKKSSRFATLRNTWRNRKKDC